jgi:cation-transporting ATPase E
MKTGSTTAGDHPGENMPDGSRPQDGLKGLTQREVRARVREGKTNSVRQKPSRSLLYIIRANVFNRFNAILGALVVVVLLKGSPGDAIFGLVIVFNSLIGIVQELRAKRKLDKLSLLTAPRARVIREGRDEEIPADEVVLDDVLRVRPGDQILVDGSVLESRDLQVDESLLTGESVPVYKSSGDRVLSGSFVAAGSGAFRATAVGGDSYAQKLTAEARKFTRVDSDINKTINTILRYVSWIIFPVGAAFIASQLLTNTSLSSAISGTVAALVSMIPYGLVLLVSVVFAASAILLARHNVLVQELPAVEVLARVDVLCLDKTGTLTEGDLEFGGLEPLQAGEGAREALAALAAAWESENATIRAIAAAFPSPPDWRREDSVPFSPARKWSAVRFEGHRSWILGAPEILLQNVADDGWLGTRAQSLASSGSRVLLLAATDAPLQKERLPQGMEAAAFVIIEEKVRPDAAQTIDYFEEQGVQIKVISGDNPDTVAAVARRVGVPGWDHPIDARSIPGDVQDLEPVMEEASVFGRVVPEQKRVMVRALQGDGHVVGMTGDGVNDTLALKDADLGIAMGSGAPSTKSVAEVVLLDGKFSTMPRMVSEGRRVVFNMERVSKLFINKTVYASLLAIGFAIAAKPFLFLPRQVTFIDTLTIGVPGLILSFAPSSARYVPGLLRRILLFTLPAGIISASITFAADAMARTQGATLDQTRTVSVIVLTIIGLGVLAFLIRPLLSWRGLLIPFMAAGLVGAFLIPFVKDFLMLELPKLIILVQALAIAAIALLLLQLVLRQLSDIEGAEKPMSRRKVQ